MTSTRDLPLDLYVMLENVASCFPFLIAEEYHNMPLVGRRLGPMAELEDSTVSLVAFFRAPRQAFASYKMYVAVSTRYQSK